MTVRELIEELLDCPMDSQINVELNLNDDTEWETFDITETVSTHEFHINVDLQDKVLIDADEYEQLKELED